MRIKIHKIAFLAICLVLLLCQNSQAERPLLCFDCNSLLEEAENAPQCQNLRANELKKRRAAAADCQKNSPEIRQNRCVVTPLSDDFCATTLANARVKKRKPSTVENCARPNGVEEALICSSEEMVALDREMMRVFQEKRDSFKDKAAGDLLSDSQNEWIENRYELCDILLLEDDAIPHRFTYSCYKKKLELRIRSLKNWTPISRPTGKSVYIEIDDDEIDPIIKAYRADTKKATWPRMMTLREKAALLAHVFRRNKDKHDLLYWSDDKCPPLLQALQDAKGFHFIAPEIVTDKWEEIFAHVDLKHCSDPSKFVENWPQGDCVDITIAHWNEAEIFVPKKNVALYKLGGESDHAFYGIYGENYMYETGHILGDQRCTESDFGANARYRVIDANECSELDAHTVSKEREAQLAFIKLKGEVFSLLISGVDLYDEKSHSLKVHLRKVGKLGMFNQYRCAINKSAAAE